MVSSNKIILIAVAIVILGIGYWMIFSPRLTPLEDELVEKFRPFMNSNECADIRNDFYIIDEKFVLRIREGNCADARYSTTLYDGDPSKYCTYGDSIAGPQTFCSDPQVQLPFEAVMEDVVKYDRGLETTHRVRKISVAK